MLRFKSARAHTHVCLYIIRVIHIIFMFVDIVHDDVLPRFSKAEYTTV